MFKAPLSEPDRPSKKLKIDQELDEFINQAENVSEFLDAKTLKQMVHSLEKSITRNEELRGKYEGEPMKYLERYFYICLILYYSEADLVETCKSFTRLSSNPSLYPLFSQLQGHYSIMQLLGHPNSDVGISAIGLLNELTDDDVRDENDEHQDGLIKFVKSLISDGLLKLILETIQKLDESRDEDREGVFNALSLLENLSSIIPEQVNDICAVFCPWMLERVAQKGFDSVRGYVAELFAIMLQSSRENRVRVAELGGLETLLMILAYYRKRDPKEADEVEMMENIFDSVCGIVQEEDLAQKFLEQEGVELMLITIK
jgi:beta-catenin-like protein 1